jgi:hypothetical protein
MLTSTNVNNIYIEIIHKYTLNVPRVSPFTQPLKAFTPPHSINCPIIYIVPINPTIVK